MYMSTLSGRDALRNRFVTFVLTVLAIDMVLTVMTNIAGLDLLWIDLCAAVAHLGMAAYMWRIRKPVLQFARYGFYYFWLATGLVQDVFIVGLAGYLVFHNCFLLAVSIAVSWGWLFIQQRKHHLR